MWTAANYGTGKMHWFLVREIPGQPAEYHERKDGQLRRYGSYATADRAAARLNAAA